MSVNSAGEFRNVFPLIVQELVRQSATISTQQQIETEKTKQVEAHAEMAAAKFAQDRLECVKREEGKKENISTKDLVDRCGPAPLSAAFGAGGESRSADASAGPSVPGKPAVPATPTAPVTPGGDKKPAPDAKKDSSGPTEQEKNPPLTKKGGAPSTTGVTGGGN